MYRDRRIKKRVFKANDLVLMVNSWFRLFLSKMKSKWSRPFKVTQVFLSGVVELENKDEKLFKVNSQRVKNYMDLLEELKFLLLVS